MKKIAITGGIGSGKSLAVECIRELGYSAFSCDEIYRELLFDKEYISKIKALFPSACKGENLNRAELGRIIFEDKNARARLNSISHPLIMKRLFAYMDKCDETLVFAEVPLLFEGGFQLLFDAILVITRPLSERVQAICERDTATQELALKKIQAQFDYDAPAAKEIIKQCGGIILQNNGNKEELFEKLKKTIKYLL